MQGEASHAGVKARDPVAIDLALQGGGAHGAFTWGVLDRLLEEPWLRIEGISGTSAGAMNAAVLIDGHAEGGPEGARAALERFWRRVSHSARLQPLPARATRHPFGPLDARTRRRYFSPWISPRACSRPTTSIRTGYNPLRDILAESVDFGRLAKAPIRLFVTATNVRTGQGRVFRNVDVTPDALLASACLPTLFQAVEIEGEAYWDGGYAGNPTITPLVRECASNDTILVQINPVERPGTPRTAREIINRVNEVSFNATLLKELRMIAVLRAGREPGRLRGRALGRDAHPSHRERGDDGARLLL